jgi:WD40 repeat protein
VGLSSTFVAGLVAETHSAAAVPSALVHCTAQAAVALAGGKAAGISPPVAVLVAGGLGTIILTKAQIVSAVTLAVLLIGSVIGVRAFQPAAVQLEASEGKEAAVPTAEDFPKGPVDTLGDPLPPGASMRLGTRRHRVQDWPLPWHDLPDGRSYLIYQRIGSRSEIRRLEAGSGRVIESWPVPDRHHVAGFSPDGRCALMETSFVFYFGFRRPGQKDEREWVLTLYDLAQRKKVWDQRAILEQKDWKDVESACFSAAGKWIATRGRQGHSVLRLWDGTTGKELWSFKPNAQTLEPLGFTDGDSALVVRGMNDNTISLFDRATGKCQRSFPTMDRKDVQGCGLSPDGSAVLFGRYGSSIRVWDVATGHERPALDGHKQWARRFAFTPDGKTLITGGNDSFVLVRDWPAGKVVRTIDLGRGAISRMTISGDARRLEVLFWGEQALAFYDLATGKAIPPLAEGHRAGVYGVAALPEGELISFGKDATVRTWDPTMGKAIGRLPVEQDLNAGGFAASRDGRLLATPNTNNDAVCLYERATGKQVRKLPAKPGVMKHLIFSPDGRWLAGADRYDGVIQVWEVAIGKLALELKGKVVDGVTCAFSPDSRQFAVTGEGRVRFWDTGSWKEQSDLAAYAPWGLAYSPDGRVLVAAGVEGVRLFELATRRERAHLQTPHFPYGGLQFSPSGRWLAWVNSQTTIHVWDVLRGQLIVPFTGHDDVVTGLAFTADERILASSSADSTLLLWDLVGAAAKNPPKVGDLDQAWQALGGDDAKAAYEAIQVLASSPDEAVKRMIPHLKPAIAVDGARIDACLVNLDSPTFVVRDQATRELEQLGDQTEAALERYLAGKLSLEARKRAEQVLAKVRAPVPERLRRMRALEALEHMNSEAAWQLIEALTKGAPAAGLTRDAKRALARRRR